MTNVTEQISIDYNDDQYENHKYKNHDDNKDDNIDKDNDNNTAAEPNYVLKFLSLSNIYLSQFV